ncbi:MAG: sugar phosphate isomerase/epimerase [bacterium]|nr:sugar phosphate isomerase/epimerase [bacterium]
MKTPTSPKIGILQGRLTPSRGRGIQFFPDDNWEQEFDLAREVGLSHIQWVFDTLQNPLLDKAFRESVKAAIARTGVPVRNMDLQLLVKMDIAQFTEKHMSDICSALSDIQGGNVELPLLEASSLLDGGMREKRVLPLERFVACATKHGVGIALETDLAPKEYAVFLSAFPSLTVVYDTGNSAGMGYDMEAELSAYGGRISNVHIKDKKKGGSTIQIGTGDAPFACLFKRLRALSYTGPVTIQAARGPDGEEVRTVTEQAALIRKWISE